VNIAQAIDNGQLNSTISLDLSHIGLAISKDLCMENLNTICSHAVRANIDYRLNRFYSNVAILKRSVIALFPQPIPT
jgi:hypothetical protein